MKNDSFGAPLRQINSDGAKTTKPVDLFLEKFDKTVDQNEIVDEILTGKRAKRVDIDAINEER